MPFFKYELTEDVKIFEYIFHKMISLKRYFADLNVDEICLIYGNLTVQITTKLNKSTAHFQLIIINFD